MRADSPAGWFVFTQTCAVSRAVRPVFLHKIWCFIWFSFFQTGWQIHSIGSSWIHIHEVMCCMSTRSCAVCLRSCVLCVYEAMCYMSIKLCCVLCSCMLYVYEVVCCLWSCMLCVYKVVCCVSVKLYAVCLWSYVLCVYKTVLCFMKLCVHGVVSMKLCVVYLWGCMLCDYEVCVLCLCYTCYTRVCFAQVGQSSILICNSTWHFFPPFPLKKVSKFFKMAWSCEMVLQDIDSQFRLPVSLIDSPSLRWNWCVESIPRWPQTHINNLI